MAAFLLLLGLGLGEVLKADLDTFSAICKGTQWSTAWCLSYSGIEGLAPTNKLALWFYFGLPNPCIFVFLKTYHSGLHRKGILGNVVPF